MSIALLGQVYDETRRLAIAGSVAAGGDFRLKKLTAPLEQAGAKAPVFAKVAEAVKNVVDGPEKNSAVALLELTTLVSAILYTQGETGMPGTLGAIETTDLGAPTSQASARVIKPLLEALTTTGAGRLELIKDACERGAFRDLRLVKPALDAIDDVYGEIGDLIAEKVLPLYGKAILPELRAKLDLKGRAGHPRRLHLMHKLDPAGTRDLVKQALDAGSKEVKVVAIECLGAEPEDLSYLIEQAAAKAQDVRQAAYQALSALDHDEAVAVLRKAMTGKDLSLAATSLLRSRSPKVLKLLLSEAKKEADSLPATKEKKEASQKIGRLQMLLGCLSGREDADTEAFIMSLFGRRAELAVLKGDTLDGADLNSSIVNLMQEGTKATQVALAEAHAQLSGDDLVQAFYAARHALPPGQVFEMFSPYLAAKGDKKKSRDGSAEKREAMLKALDAHESRYWGYSQLEGLSTFDPRWLDLAVGMEHLALVRQLVRPGHAGANAFLQKSFDAALKKSKSLDECFEAVSAMVNSEHPGAVEAFIAAFEKHSKKGTYYTWWFMRLITELPQSAVPRLEALLPNLDEKTADNLIIYIQQLREKK
jgi:hypothetical protein